jgi:hypothetical protein
MDDAGPPRGYARSMLDYARQRVIEVLKAPCKAVLATSGPAGLQASEHPCQAIGLDLYLLVLHTSDHLFNLEYAPAVTLLAAGWEMKGEAHLVPPDSFPLDLSLLQEPGAKWCTLVRVAPHRVQIRREDGWGNLETIDLKPC